MKYLSSFKHLILFFAFLISTNIRTEAQNLSANSKVSLITVEPGNELNDAFGHTLLWIYDPVNQIDKAYNFGVYDFETENFYWKFVKGQLPYKMSHAPLMAYQEYYQQQHRNMTEQVLDISASQKQIVYNHLENTYNDPSKRVYMYKFFYDNCATRVRDAMMLACTDSVHLQNIPEMNDSTYRQWMNKCLIRKHHYWSALGMNIALGAPADERILQFKACYLPENLQKSMRAAKRMTHHVLRFLVRSENPLYSTTPIDEEPLFIFTPRFWLLLIFLFTGYKTYFHWKRRQKGYSFDKILFSVAGLIGWLLLFLWFGTDHGVTDYNRNLLWAFPLHLPLVWFMQERNGSYWYGYYYILVGLLLAMGLFYAVQYSWDITLLVLILIIRAFYHAGFEREHRMTQTKFRKIIKGRRLEVIHSEHNLE
ncbi:putative membrane protein [Arcicella rosea]|uniref:lipoprotein N-acyltransferase Lnb domain-containing protein n=1 Tax=Arcicella rosea TaxID=502909 RepID=UPI00345DF320